MLKRVVTSKKAYCI